MQSCMLLHIQNLLGQLQFATVVVEPGRAFVRRMYDALCGINTASHMIHILDDMRSDLFVWHKFLLQYNGRTLFLPQEVELAHDLDIHSDASFAYGVAVCGKRWFRVAYPPSWARLHITFLELFPIFLSMFIFQDAFANRRLRFHCDNMAVVMILNTQSSRNKNVMSLVRAMVLQSLKINVKISAAHVRGSATPFQTSLAVLLMSHLYCRNTLSIWYPMNYSRDWIIT